MEKPVLLEFEYSHDCWCIDAVEKTGAAARCVYHHTPSKGLATALIEVKGEGVEKAVESFRKEKDVVGVDVLTKGKSSALINVRHKPNTLIAEAVESANCIPLYPSLTEGDKDILVILAPKEKSLHELKSLLKERCSYYNLRFKKYLSEDKPGISSYPDYLKLKTLTSQLTEKQVELFAMASRKGYYDNPRKITLQELAEDSGIAKSTLSEHLRKVESKILPLMGEISRF